MTDWEKKRDSAACEYVREGDCEVFDTWGAHEETFKAGAEWAREHLGPLSIEFIEAQRAADKYEIERLKAELAESVENHEHFADLYKEAMNIHMPAWREQALALYAALNFIHCEHGVTKEHERILREFEAFEKEQG